MKKEVKIGLIGYGTIGQGVVRLLKENKKEIQSRLGAQLKLVGVADKDWKRKRKYPLEKSLRLNDAYQLINNPEIDIIIQLVGDFPGVKEMLIASLKTGKYVVTANKAVLAKYGKEIFQTAVRTGSQIFFEASVGGGIPVLRALRTGLCANQIQEIYGIVNGTCNYIITEMEQGRGEYKDVLKEAQRLGYAEADPGADVEGIDALHKLVILVLLGYGVSLDINKIYREGISDLSLLDFRTARDLGYRLRLLAIARQENGFIDARVHPTLIPANSLLAKVEGVYNAIYVRGNFVGPTLFYGQGAGMEPTASAVVSDVMELARNLLSGKKSSGIKSSGYYQENPRQLKFKPIEELKMPYYLRLWVLDQPGVLAKISGILAKHKISIRSVIQREGREGDSVPLVIITHLALEKSVQKAVREINRLKVVIQPAKVIRILTELEK